jgi:C4-dicarboxylate-specific signal transduction histidine kinase
VRVVERTVEGETEAIEARSQELSLYLPSGEVWVDGDPTRLEQVILNLLANGSQLSVPAASASTCPNSSPTRASPPA